MRGRRAIGGLAAVALLCASPAAAATTPPSASALLAGASRLSGELALLGRGATPLSPPRGSALAELRFKNHDGYTIAVSAFRQTVAISVTRGHGHRSTTTYLAHGKVTPSSIRASFADRGRIAVRFRPSGRGLRAGRRVGCAARSGGVIARLGVFVGELRFRGEGGYTSAEVHRARGGSIDVAALIACLLGGAAPGRNGALPPAGLLAAGPAGANRRSPSPPGVPTYPSTGPRPTALLADAKLPLSRTLFAAEAPGRGRDRFLAAEESSEGPIGILRIALVPGPRAAFAFDDALSLGGVTPPAPFSGSATFLHGPGGTTSWTGSLGVSFLGAPDVPLTGASFSTRLTRGF
jgi:hypothetical protein